MGLALFLPLPRKNQESDGEKDNPEQKDDKEERE